MNQDPQQSNSNKGTNHDSSPYSALDEVRKQLQSFGYLNSRIERFYLLSISNTASQFLSRFLLSFRVGLLAGTLSALLMTAGTLLLNPELTQKKIDILLLFLYFEVFFVFLMTILEFILIFVVSGLVRFTGGKFLFLSGQIVSFLVGLSFFAYFFFWGKMQFEYFRLFSVSSLIILFLILTVSSIFVAKCSWLGFIVAFRESEMGKVLPNWRRHSIEVLLSVVAIIALLPIVLKSQDNPDKGPPLAVRSTPDRWIVIGIDGLTFDLVDKFASKGDISGIQNLAKQSFVGKMQASEASIPPVSWTSIATGVSPAQHGIVMPEVRRWRGLSSWMQVTPFELALHSILFHSGFGQRQPVSGYLRKVKAFWEILSDSGIRAGVVNWWGSWPALPMRGWNVSERYYYKLLSGKPAQDETFPRGIFSTFEVNEKNKRISGPELDRFYSDVFLKQLESDPVRVGALYLPGFDILNYEFFEARKLDPFGYTDQYSTHLQWLEGFLEEVRTKHPGYHLMLIFYPGRSLNADNGGFLLTGFGNLRSQKLYSEVELVPLLLYSCGLPVAQSMKTGLLQTVIPPQRLAQIPIQSVVSFPAEQNRIDSSHADAFDEVLVEQLKSLGYLQ